MLRTLLMGAAAGAVGTVALDITTYLDMAIRGRPSSEVPARTAVRLASAVGADLEPRGQAVSPEAEQQAHSRQSGVGALMGYSGWLADLVPHLAYGMFTAAAYEAFTAGELSRRGRNRAAYLAAAAEHAYRY